MTYAILGFFVGVGLVLIFSHSVREKTSGICEAVLGQSSKKRENKEKILALLRENSKLSNSDIREALRTTDRTVVNYMDELEKEGWVEQVGNTGRGVAYKLKNG